MGLMTNITILNDHINEINNNPTAWWNSVYHQICSTQARELNYSNETTVNSVEHADTTTILAVGGNHTTVLGYTQHTSHHKEEQQVEILKSLAADLGYRLVKKAK
jgi:putative N-acetylmannosamine-6-phosphate epimerase